MASDGTLGSREVRFIGALLGGQDVPRGAELAGVSERTGWRYLERPQVRRELARRQDAALGEAGARLSVAMSASVDVMCSIRDDVSVSPAVRLAAARWLLDTCLKWREQVILAERLTAVEQRLTERQASESGIRIGGLKAGDI